MLVPLGGKNKILIPKSIHDVAHVCSYYRNLIQFSRFQQICRCVLKFGQFDKISSRTCVFAYKLLH